MDLYEQWYGVTMYWYPYVPPTPPPAKPHDPVRFPHRCPRCKGWCYIGFSMVEHEYPCTAATGEG